MLQQSVSVHEVQLGCVSLCYNIQNVFLLKSIGPVCKSGLTLMLLYLESVLIRVYK